MLDGNKPGPLCPFFKQARAARQLVRGSQSKGVGDLITSVTTSQATSVATSFAMNLSVNVRQQSEGQCGYGAQMPLKWVCAWFLALAKAQLSMLTEVFKMSPRP
jgi:hypothetical protein